MINATEKPYYHAYGLTIDSTLPLPELPVCGADELTKPDVTIRIGEIAGLPNEAKRANRYINVEGEKIYLSWQDVGAFSVKDGREITIDPNPGVAEHVLRLFILGTTFAMLLHQRREVVVLHASVVSIAKQAVAFVGRKGAGKSTMAAALHMYGYELIADDILAIDWREQTPHVLPGFPHIKLWPDSVSVLNRDPTELPRLRPEVDKRGYRLSDGFLQRSIPLRAIFTLEVGAAIRITPLPKKAAFAALAPHWYGARFGRQILNDLGVSTHFLECMQLAKNVEVCQLTRPRALENLPKVVAAVEAHAGISRQKPMERPILEFPLENETA